MSLDKRKLNARSGKQPRLDSLNAGLLRNIALSGSLRLVLSDPLGDHCDGQRAVIDQYNNHSEKLD